MRALHTLYVIVLVVSLSLSLTLVFYYRYQKLNQYSAEALKKANATLETLDKTIAALEKDNAGFKSQLQALRKEREQLQAEIAKLTEEKSLLEQKFLSLKELKKAIKMVRMKQSLQRRAAKMAMLEREDAIALQQGNRGYLVRNSNSTFKSKITVELEPLNKLSYKGKDQ